MLSIFKAAKWGKLILHQVFLACIDRIIQLLHLVFLQVWDLRSAQQSGAIPEAHGMAVRSVDFAKQQDNLIVTAGDDCKLRLWDLRRVLAHFVICNDGVLCFKTQSMPTSWAQLPVFDQNTASVQLQIEATKAITSPSVGAGCLVGIGQVCSHLIQQGARRMPSVLSEVPDTPPRAWDKHGLGASSCMRPRNMHSRCNNRLILNTSRVYEACTADAMRGMY